MIAANGMIYKYTRIFSKCFILISILFFSTSPLFAQRDSLVSDTTKKIKPAEDAALPDTVFLINGDKITGSIVSFKDSRLKINAQGFGLINIRSNKIISIGGGSRMYKAMDVHYEIFTGHLHLAKDTGEIILQGKNASLLKLKDLQTLYPLEDEKDSLLPQPSKKTEQMQTTMLKHIPDTIYLKNGEIYTGNILSLEQGRVKIDAQGPGVIFIKWHKIVSISGGSRDFKVEDQGGEIYIGEIKVSKDTGEVLVVNKKSYGIMLSDIVRMFPLEEEWYRGFKGNVSGGGNYTKSSDVLTLSFDYNLYYVIKKWRFINNFSYISTSVGGEDPSLRLTVDLQSLYALQGRWLLSEINSYNRNDELGIRGRISFGVGPGYNLVVTDKQRLLILTGILQNTERDESNNRTSNFELPFTLQHLVYSFLSPNLTSSTLLASYFGITEKGRTRFDASTNITWEFITNVKLQFTVYFNYDNKILEGKKSKEDYGTVLSLLVDLK